MLTHLTDVLINTGLPRETAATLAAVVVTPPPGSIAVAELTEASAVQLVLLAAVVAATDVQQFGEALQHLLEVLRVEQTALTDYDAGRFWHLKGVVAWRLEHALYAATRALNRSLTFLRGVPTPQAQGYLARVYDTSGQLLQYQGLLSEARREFELALSHRDPADAEGTALTLGNLGRLCLDLGDFASAATYFAQDLAMVTQRTPEQTHIRTQLLSHLGTCALEDGRLTDAQEVFTQSATLAVADGNAYGLAFAVLGLGKIALRRGDIADAQRQAEAALTHLNTADAPAAMQAGVRGLIRQLLADIHLAEHQPAQAVEAFQEALQHFAQASTVSPVEMAQLLQGLARAHRQQGEGQSAAALFRDALQYLEPTTADQLRQDIETELQTDFPESWLFHTAGRFLGPRKHTEFLLREAGRGGFRGEQQDVVILFSDIRGFTTIAEQLGPAQLITCLNDYLGHMTRCVDMFGGLVDKFIGDAVMAVFSLPTPQPDDAERAVQAALTMRDELERFNRGLPADVPPLAIGLGLHRGAVLAGLIGSPQKRSYTVIGDAVNTASRLESMTKHLGASILVSQDIIQQLPHPDRYLCRPLGKYALKGKHTSVAVVDIVGEDDGSRFARAIRQEITAVAQALHCFSQRQFGAAQDALLALAQEAAAAGYETHAHGYQFLADTARAYSHLPLAPDWDGTIVMMDK
jgi:class 3 adenylate cyclase/predicted negative regulator of RcsB-dependent stress response